MKIYNLTITDGQKQYRITAATGELLLDVLRNNSILIPASCNGKGTCEKCKVTVAGKGMVLACQYQVGQDLEAIRFSQAAADRNQATE